MKTNKNAWKQRNKEGNSCNHNMQTYIIISSCLCYKTNLFVAMVSEKKKLEVLSGGSSSSLFCSF